MLPPNLERFLEVDVLAEGRPTLGVSFAHQALQALDAASKSPPASAGRCIPVDVEPVEPQEILLESLSGRAISVSDSPLCCLALARVSYRYAETLDPGCLRVLASGRSQLFGVNPDADPDATQGVYQIEVMF